jgi:hypothetical protein
MQFNGPLLATYLLISVLTKPDEIVLYIIIQIQNINLKLNMKEINTKSFDIQQVLGIL